MSLIRQTAWAASAAVVLAGSRFVFTAIIARQMSPAVFGQFVYGQWLADLSFLVCSLGATGVIGRYLAEYRSDSRVGSMIVRKWIPYAAGLPFMAGLVSLVGAWISNLSLSTFGATMLMVWAVANGVWAMQTAALV
ncbi:hypothetical protein, partial [Dokdonella sp.]|uniref:hypothetical protein n=1 Tax=Dokdonella sp. TaxID=2291710 RepID=UPI0027BA8CED